MPNLDSLFRSIASSQDLVGQLMRGTTGKSVGTIDYQTGDVTLDLSQMQDYLYTLVGSTDSSDYTFGDADYAALSGEGAWERLNLTKSFVRISWRGIDFSGGMSGGLVFPAEFKNFPQFIVTHTVKGFGIINKAKVDAFLELACFFEDPVDVGKRVPEKHLLLLY